MTYNVFGGTLNLAQSIHFELTVVYFLFLLYLWLFLINLQLTVNYFLVTSPNLRNNLLFVQWDVKL